MHSKFSYQFATYCYKLLYVKLIIITKHKSRVDTQKIMRKKSKHTIKENQQTQNPSKIMVRQRKALHNN